MKTAGVTDPSRCLFVDDNLGNVRAAKKLGWGSSVYFLEHSSGADVSSEKPVVEGVDAVISSLEELRTIWDFAFKVPVGINGRGLVDDRD